MGDLVAFNYGRYLPNDEKMELKRAVEKITAILDQNDPESVDFQLIDMIFEVDGLNASMIKGGKDTYFLVELNIENHHMILKYTRWNVYQLAYYMFTIIDFRQKITEPLEVHGAIKLEIIPAFIYAFAEVILNEEPIMLLIQQFSEGVDYLEFTNRLSTVRKPLPVNFINIARHYLQKEGYTIDSMPKNFHIKFNNKLNLCQLTYLDYIHSNDKGVKDRAIEFAEKFEQGQISHRYFTTF